jgi:hypothetical protein
MAYFRFNVDTAGTANKKKRKKPVHVVPSKTKLCFHPKPNRKKSVLPHARMANRRDFIKVVGVGGVWAGGSNEALKKRKQCQKKDSLLRRFCFAVSAAPHK